MAQEVLAGGPSEDAEYPETDSRVPGGGEWPAPLPVVISWCKRWLARVRKGTLHRMCCSHWGGFALQKCLLYGLRSLQGVYWTILCCGADDRCTLLK